MRSTGDDVWAPFCRCWPRLERHWIRPGSDGGPPDVAQHPLLSGMVHWAGADNSHSRWPAFVWGSPCVTSPSPTDIEECAIYFYISVLTEWWEKKEREREREADERWGLLVLLPPSVLRWTKYTTPSLESKYRYSWSNTAPIKGKVVHQILI